MNPFSPISTQKSIVLSKPISNEESSLNQNTSYFLDFEKGKDVQGFYSRDSLHSFKIRLITQEERLTDENYLPIEIRIDSGELKVFYVKEDHIKQALTIDKVELTANALIKQADLERKKFILSKISNSFFNYYGNNRPIFKDEFTSSDLKAYFKAVEDDEEATLMIASLIKKKVIEKLFLGDQVHSSKIRLLEVTALIIASKFCMDNTYTNIARIQLMAPLVDPLLISPQTFNGNGLIHYEIAKCILSRINRLEIQLLTLIDYQVPYPKT
jgi:hypothetical protein